MRLTSSDLSLTFPGEKEAYLEDPVSGVVCRTIMTQQVVVADEPVLPAKVYQPPGATLLSKSRHVVPTEITAHNGLGVCLLAGWAACLHLLRR